MHFSASSQWSKICFGYQEIIFNRKKVLNFSQIESVSLTDSSQFFFDDFPKRGLKVHNGKAHRLEPEPNGRQEAEQLCLLSFPVPWSIYNCEQLVNL